MGSTSLWVLVGWMALYPTERLSIGTFSSLEQCEERASFLFENRKKRFQRHYECLEVQNPACLVDEEPTPP